MKTKTTIFKSLAITAIMVVSALAAMAQAPESFNYQAVIRDASGELNSNADMNVRFTIKEDGPSGTSIYREFEPELLILEHLRILLGVTMACFYR